ncbi:sensor histidine kinase [Membranihabitans marinus]|uniref:Sensor histidine kinase n=2 Tax=Nesterenkonia rhizosphaerae TaxID=1348272 RepID=A0ABP9FUU2_9MICC
MTKQATSQAHLMGILYAGIWLVFLFIPAYAALVSETGWGWRITAWAATAAFAALYLWRMAVWMQAVERGHPPTPKAMISTQLLLAALVGLTLPAIGVYGTTFSTFMAALVVFSYRPKISIPIGVALWAVPSSAAIAISNMQGSSFWDGLYWAVLGPGIGVFFIVLIRLQEYYEHRERHKEQQLHQAAERDRIARDVHDVLGHSLTVLSIKAQLARRLMEAEPQRAQQELNEIEQLARESLTQVRNTVTQLRSPQFPSELEVARSALQAAGITPVITTNDDAERAAPLLAWALREAVTNVVRHSGASTCRIELSAHSLSVSDDGLGLGDALEGNGLRGLRERAAAAGAQISIGPASAHLRPGCRLTITCPEGAA